LFECVGSGADKVEHGSYMKRKIGFDLQAELARCSDKNGDRSMPDRADQSSFIKACRLAFPICIDLIVVRLDLFELVIGN